MIRHLRRNAVAYLALVLAASTSTAYAVDKLAPGSVTGAALAKNAVTSPKIKKNAVKSADIKNGSVKVGDLAAGVLPRAAEAYVYYGDAGTPTATPDGIHEDESLAIPASFVGGRVVLTFFSSNAYVDCSSSVGFVGLYVDGQPVADSKAPAPASAAGSQPIQLGTVIDLAGGAHTVRLGFDCPAGTVQVYALYQPSFAATVLAR